MIKKNFQVIRGGGGDDSDSGGSQQPVISPDSLESIAFLRILDLLCEGEIVGLVNGSQSVFLNNVPLQNADGSYNFQNVQWEQRHGTQNQDYISDASDSEQEIAVGAEFKFGNPDVGSQPCNIVQSGTAIIRTIVDPNVDSVRIRISVPQLSNTDETTGNIGGASVGYAVAIKADDDSDFVTVLNDVISGKASSKYERTREVPLHGRGPWLIRVSRNTPDAPNTFLQNTTTWESYTEITDTKMTYPNSALIGIEIDATQFDSVPTRIYECDLLKIKIPTNYDDVTRTYTGTWDGTFKISTGACSNPAWVFYDLLLSERYGLGQYIQESQVNKWALYTIARYCDELVPDGFGGMEPRFACNCFVPGRTGAYDLMQSLASVFRGMIFWAGGAITATQDAPKDPVYLYTQANVVDGKFTYQGASAQNTHTVARVTWNDPTNFYNDTVEYVEDSDGVRDRGVIETDVTAFGCTSRGQANRFGRWLLYTEKFESEICTFNAGLEAIQSFPGDIIQIADPSRAGVRMGGRVSTATTTAVTVDQVIDPTTVGALTALLPNGTLETQDIVSIVGKVITVAAPFSIAPQSHGAWVVSTTEVEPQTYSVVGVSENDDGTYTVTALKHYPSKFGFIEQGLELQIPSTSSLDSSPAIPKNLDVEESLYSVTTDVRVKATFSWDKVALASNYAVSYIFNSGNVVNLPLTQFSEIDVLDISPGSYQFSVIAINSLGRKSQPASITVTIQGKSLPPGDVQNFSMIPSQGNALLSWDRAVDLDVIMGGFVRIRWTPRTTGQAWADGIDITPGLTGNSTQAIVPLLAGTYMVKFVDSSGNYSADERIIPTDVADIQALNTVVTLEEDPTFTGDMTNMFLDTDENAITLSSSFLFDDIPDVDGIGNFDLLGDIVASGEYDFENEMNLGGIWPFKVRINVDLDAYDTGNYVDSRGDMVDDWVSWDGDVINAVTAQVLMRTTQEDPTDPSAVWTDWKPIINAEYIAWGAQFKLICGSDQPNHNLYVRQLSVVVDMDDRTWNSPKLTSLTTGDLAVAFSNDFFAAPSIGVTEENGATGDYKTITSLTASGFNISFYNSSGVRVARDFYVLAKSYGLRLT